MSKIQVNCFQCNKPINSKSDLITAPYILSVQPYHASCYSKRLRSIESIFLGNVPVNSMWGTLGALLSSFIFLIILYYFIRNSKSFTNPFLIVIAIIVACAFLIPLIFRLYSYFKYEKVLS